MQSSRKIHPAVAAIIVIVLIGLVAAVVVATRNQSDNAAVTETTREPDSEVTATPPAQTNEVTSYRNGEYTEMGTYISPGGRESIEVTLTLENDIITDATVTPNATSGEAKEYQEDFILGYKSLVVGKDIEEVSLSRVAGSSLTSNGFNSALELIKADAQA